MLTMKKGYHVEHIRGMKILNGVSPKYVKNVCKQMRIDHA